MRRNREKKSRKKIFLLCSFVFVTIFMGIGFSYFSDTITFEGTTNLYANKDYLWYKLLNDIQPSSLVPVPYENGKYAFVGSNPNNVVLIDNLKYRIVSVESDHTVKVAFPVSINTAYDSVGNRTSASTYCTDLEHGCNAFDTYSTYENGTISGSVENSSTMLNNINSEISNAITNNQSSQLLSNITEHAFNVGPVSESSTLSSIATQEQSKTWIGNIGLINLSEVLFAESGNVNATLGGTYNSYLFQNISQKYIWTMNPLANNSSKVWTITPTMNQESKYAYLTSEEENNNTYLYSALPTVYLKSTVKLSSGSGTVDDPYILQ